jgi:hypothetical protein
MQKAFPSRGLTAPEPGFLEEINKHPDIKILSQDRDISERLRELDRSHRYLMAQEAVKIDYGLMQGKKPKEELTLIPVGLIIKENVDRYAGWTK